jgi:hypothetical protein
MLSSSLHSVTSKQKICAIFEALTAELIEIFWVLVYGCRLVRGSCRLLFRIEHFKKTLLFDP